MKIYNILEAKTHLSRLVEKAAKGESFLIAKAGKPMVKVVAFDSPEPARMNRFGFMASQIKSSRNFNTMGARKIQSLFEGKE